MFEPLKVRRLPRQSEESFREANSAIDEMNRNGRIACIEGRLEGFLHGITQQIDLKERHIARLQERVARLEAML